MKRWIVNLEIWFDSLCAFSVKMSDEEMYLVFESNENDFF